MKLYLSVSSFNDIITNSSTEILSVKSEFTVDVLKELLFNYALEHDYDEKVTDSDISISKVDPLEELVDLFGEFSEEEYNKFMRIMSKRYNLDPEKPGDIYSISIEEGLDNTIEFLQKKLGAV